MASLDITLNQLNAGLKTLRSHWEMTRNLWSDVVSHSFERNYYEPLADQARATLKEMQYLARVIAEARRQVH